MKNLFQKINYVSSKIKQLEKDTTVEVSKTRSYQAISHDGVTEAIKPYCDEVGILFFVSSKNSNLQRLEKVNQDGYKSSFYLFSSEYSVRIQNADDKEDFIVVDTFGYAEDSSDKACGKALSMALKNVQLKTFRIVSGENEEERQPASQHYQKPVEQKVDPASPAQIKLIAGLAAKKNVVIENIEKLNKREASNWIEKLNKG